MGLGEGSVRARRGARHLDRPLAGDRDEQLLWPAQFVGLWRDKAWHQQLTHMIKFAEITAELSQGRLYGRL
jgi:hypothetical protein